MVWGWINNNKVDEMNSSSSAVDFVGNHNSDSISHSYSGEACSTRKVVKSQCKTEEVEPGKFIRKCERTEEILKSCTGRPVEVVSSNKEYTEDDVTDQVVKGLSSPPRGFDEEDVPFGFPGLRNDIDRMEDHFLGSFDWFLGAAEEMKNNLFYLLGELPSSRSSPGSRRFPTIQGRGDLPSRPDEPRPSSIPLSELATEV